MGGGDMGALMRSMDSSKTALGPVESRSPSLQIIVRALLGNRLQMFIWWGPQRALQQHRTELQKRGEHSALQGRYDSLTPREREAFSLVTNGLLNKQIAAEPGASEKTIKIHPGHVMHKRNAGSPADLVRMAEKLQIAALRSESIRTKVR